MKKIAKPILELSNVCRSDKKSKIERLNLSIPAGDSFAVLYKNKDNISLLTEILSGRVSPKKGKVFFKGDDITGSKNNFGVIKRSPVMPKRKTVADNAAAPIIKRGLSRELAGILVRKELKALGYEELADRSFSSLSKKDTAFALWFEAYMRSHEFIVIDEPFSELEGDDKEQLFDMLRKLCKESSLSLLIFTQDIDVALRFGDYIMVVDKNTESKGIISSDPKKPEKTRERISELYSEV